MRSILRSLCARVSRIESFATCKNPIYAHSRAPVHAQLLVQSLCLAGKVPRQRGLPRSAEEVAMPAAAKGELAPSAGAIRSTSRSATGAPPAAPASSHCGIRGNRAVRPAPAV